MLQVGDLMHPLAELRCGFTMSCKTLHSLQVIRSEQCSSPLTVMGGTSKLCCGWLLHIKYGMENTPYCRSLAALAVLVLNFCQRRPKKKQHCGRSSFKVHTGSRRSAFCSRPDAEAGCTVATELHRWLCHIV